MSVVGQHQVPMVQMVQKTVGHEESQSACVIATGGVAAHRLQFECGSKVEPGDNSTRAAAER